MSDSAASYCVVVVVIGNESVPKIMMNDTANLFF